MVIAQDTEYVLLDEPTNNLDIYHATNMKMCIRDRTIRVPAKWLRLYGNPEATVDFGRSTAISV